MKYIAILLTVHNRKEKTLQCLDCVISQEKLEGYSLDIFLTDDGCDDGTVVDVLVKFPFVKVIKGDGSLYWNRGMYLAWDTASSIKMYDYYLWINDDTYLNENALIQLLTCSFKFNDRSIIVGTTCRMDDQSILTYGGREKNGSLIFSESCVISCHHFNGNIVLIPNYVFNIVGKNDPIFHHSLGDFDYGLRAKKFGINSYVAPMVHGICDEHSNLPSWCNPSVSIINRWKHFRTPLGNNPEIHFLFEMRHYGIIIAIFHYFTNHIRVLFPYFWIQKTK